VTLSPNSTDARGARSVTESVTTECCCRIVAILIARSGRIKLVRCWNGRQTFYEVCWGPERWLFLDGRAARDLYNAFLEKLAKSKAARLLQHVGKLS
jgi:hypothetical protein